MRHAVKPQSTLLPWSSDQFGQFGQKAARYPHQVLDQESFDDEALIQLLDDYPRQWLQCFTMGNNPHDDDWRAVDVGNLNGRDILQAAQRGRFWFNLIHFDRAAAQYRRLIDQLYAELRRQCPHMAEARTAYSTLLLSSPGAHVQYHLDSEPNMLVHLRGQKTVWVYPAMDLRFVSQDALEDIFSGERDENIPYQLDFEDSAQVFELQAGDILSWPNNAPHRVVNQSLNVSLTTSYHTPEVERRHLVQLANRHLLRPLGIQSRSMQEHGPAAAFKCFSYRALNKLRPFKRSDARDGYLTRLRLDPQAPQACTELNDMIRPNFALPA